MPSDEELVRAWRTGSRSAADALTQRYYWRVFRFFELKLQWQAEDLTQRTFLLCLEQQDRIHSSFRSYLFGIARRQLTRALRDRYADAHRRRRLGEPSPGAHQTRLSALAAQRQEQQVLLRAMAELSPDTQMTLALYYWEAMNAAQLAEVFEVSHSAMRSRLAKARADLRASIDAILTSPAVQHALHVDLDGWARSVAAVNLPPPARST